MTYDKHDCDLMCERLGAYIEGDLTPDERAVADQHLAECATCAEALVELRAIAGEAAQLPLLTPSRDLWSGIESRIATSVTPLGGGRSLPRRLPRQWHFAAAAAALIAVSAGTTYLVTTRSGPAAAPVATVATTSAAPRQDSPSVTVPAPAPATAPSTTPRAATAPTAGTLVGIHRKDADVTRVYDREIALLDSLVRTRREALDPKTVQIIERNLKIIDGAIAESRAALAKDPKSPLLNNQLDNVLGSKVELLRTVAFLPSQS